MGGWSSGVMLPDIPRALTALAEWMSCFVPVLCAEERPRGLRLFAAGGLFLALQSAFLILTDGMEGVLWFLCMAAAAAMMFCFLQLCLRQPPLTTGYLCVEAFVLAEFTASLHWQIYCFLMYGEGFGEKAALPLLLLTLVGIYGGVQGAVLLLSRRFLRRKEAPPIAARELVPAVGIGLSVFLISNMGFVFSATPFSGSYSSEIFSLRTLVDLGGVAVIYAYHIQLLNLHMQNDMMVLEAMLQSQYRQYCQSKEIQDQLNFKYHDLKNYILIMRGEKGKASEEVLDRIESEIREYECENKTGHPVLDTLLSAKTIACRNRQIDFTVVADGALLSFMDTVDICSVFGNALDNAIECECRIEDPAKRMIELSVTDSGTDFVMIRCDNYCEEETDLSETLPRSTKGNPNLHGYGLKSMRRTVRHYGGEMVLSREDNWFRLRILIPKQQAAAGAVRAKN